MRPPTLTWTALNLFRLAAVVFMVWALVAQFLALATDMKAYSAASSGGSDANPIQSNATVTSSPSSIQSSTSAVISPSISSSSSSPSSPSSSSTTSTTSLAVANPSSEPQALGSFSGISLSRLTITPTVTASDIRTATDSDDEPTGMPVIGSANDDGDGGDGGGAGGDRGGNGYGQDQRRRSAALTALSPTPSPRMVVRDELDTQGEVERMSKYMGSSSVPDQPGGVAFMITSRLVLAAILGVLVFAQLGWPEMFFHDHLSWLGPQSTPMWLGFAQIIVAFENLRVYTKFVNLVPAWALLAIGLVNVLIAIVLLYLGRRMPKSPPAPLYFNMSQRLIYWKPLPPCYSQLFEPSPEDARDGDAEGSLPPSNAQEIGLEDDDDLEKADLPESKIANLNDQTRQESQIRTTVVQATQAEHDVRRGGYPTFSGGGMTDPRRQVPTGIIETGSDGRVLRFLDEDGGGVGPRRAPRPQDVAPADGPIQPETGKQRKRRDSKAQARSSMLAPITVPGKTSAETTRRPDIPTNDVPPRPAPPRPARPPNQGSRGPTRIPSKPSRAKRADPLTPINEEQDRPTIQQQNQEVQQNSAMMTQQPQHRSSIASLGPKFPLPPSRAKRESSAGEVMAASKAVTASAIIREPRMLLEPQRVNDRLPHQAAPASQLLIGKSTEERAINPPPTLNVPPAPAIRSRTPSPRPEQATIQHSLATRTPSPTRPKLKHALSDPHSTTPTLTSNNAPLPLNPPPSSSAPSSPIKKPKGVRFDLSPTSPSPLPSTSPISPIDPTSPPRSGIRIPGTSLYLPSPFSSAPNTPRPGRHSIVSVSSGGSEMDGGRRESFASISTTGTELFKERRPEMVARESSDTFFPNRTTSDPGKKGMAEGAGGLGGRPRSVAVLGGTYLDGGREKRRHSSIDFM